MYHIIIWLKRQVFRSRRENEWMTGGEDCHSEAAAIFPVHVHWLVLSPVEPVRNTMHRHLE